MSRRNDLIILVGLILIAAAAATAVFAVEVFHGGELAAQLFGREPTATPTVPASPTPVPTGTATPAPTPTARVELVTVVVTVPTPTPYPPTATPTPSLQQLGREAARSLVKLSVPADSELDSAGSGSIIDGEKGLILTNWHVVADDAGHLLSQDGVAGIMWTEDVDLPPSLVYMGRVLPEYSDPDLDLALVQITHRVEGDEAVPVQWPLGLPAILLGDSGSVRLGDPVLLLGYPDYAEDSASWTEGTITVHDDDWIKSNALVSHGHSGGMLLNRQGELVGILTQIQWVGWDGELAVARPANAARTLVQEAIDRAQPPLAEPSPALFRRPEGDLMAVLGAPEITLRQGPGLQRPAVGSLSQGETIEILAEPESDGERLWYHVQALDSGQTGWASDDYLVTSETASKPILFSSNQSGGTDLYAIRADGTGLTQLTDVVGDEEGPSRSPDGDYLVFAHTLHSDADLYAMHTQGSQPLRLTRHRADEIQPAWSPDGRWIAYTSNRDGDTEIYLLNLASQEVEALTSNQSWDGFPAWSPDSKRIAFASRRTGNEDLFILDLASQRETRVTTNLLSDTHPAWSPHGTEIAYTRTVTEGQSTRTEIAILDLREPRNPRRLAGAPDGILYRSAEWSPDGRWLVFVAESESGTALYRIAARGGEPVKLADIPGIGESAPAWSR